VASLSPTETGREPNFCGIEIVAILDLYARFELREVEEVSAIHRQVLNLLPV
jgi:hypothetical protein